MIKIHGAQNATNDEHNWLLHIILCKNDTTSTTVISEIRTTYNIRMGTEQTI
jgi:hypothetical protein